MAEINLGQILKEEGYEARGFEPKFDVPDKEWKFSNRAPSKEQRDSIGHASYYKPNPSAGLGLNYFLPVTLEYLDEGKPASIELPFPVLTITGKKRLVETYLTQRNGTVKELISADGYEINIKGYMIGQKGSFPEADIKALQRLYEINQPISIHNVVTNIFLYRPQPKFSDKVVITEISIPEARGNKHVREYELKLVNDAPFNLMEIKDK